MKARILRSQGYIPSFAAWCVTQGLPLCFEEVSTLDEILVKTITDLQQCLTFERKLKRKSYNQFLWSSKNEDFNKEAFRRIKDQSFSPPVTSVVECRDAHITIWKRNLKVVLCIRCNFRWTSNPFYMAKCTNVVFKNLPLLHTLSGKTIWLVWLDTQDVPKYRLDGTNSDPVNCNPCLFGTGVSIGIDRMIK